MKSLVLFDFDGTLFNTPEPIEGKILFKNKTGTDWSHSGWWGRRESLDLDIFDIDLNEHVYLDYLKHSLDRDSYVILATGRLTKLKNEVQKILDLYKLNFDEVHCNPGTDTFLFKKILFENLISKHKPDLVFIYDDRIEHLNKFREWSMTQYCQMFIIDVVKKTQTIHNT